LTDREKGSLSVLPPGSLLEKPASKISSPPSKSLRVLSSHRLLARFSLEALH
jgi:hypothetical protein